MKKFAFVPLAGVVLFSACSEGTTTEVDFERPLFSTVVADPSLTIAAPTDNFLLEIVDGAPNITQISVRAYRTGGSGENSKVCGFTQFKVEYQRWINEAWSAPTTIAEGAYDGVNKRFFHTSDNPNANCPSDRTDNFNWAYGALPVGVYKLRTSAMAGQGTHESGYEDDVGGALWTETEVIVDYAAAPSVAVSLLNAAGISHRYGSGKSGGNHVADVAKEMGPGTDFGGASKTNVNGYRCAVATFLRTKATPAMVANICP
jgi:hypothetical protein